MQRKLIKLGNSSFAIALPKEWVMKSKLKKGDDVFVVPNFNGELIIMPKYIKVNDKEKAVINLNNKTYKEIEREIVAEYLRGNSILEIPVKSKEEIKNAKSALQLLPSVEVMESTNSKIIANDLLDISGISVSNIMRRMDNILRSMFEDMEPCIKKGAATQKQLDDMLKIDKEINKFYFLLWKLMLKGLKNPSVINALNTNYLNLFVNWWISLNIERIADELKRIVRIFSKTKFNEDEIKNILFSYQLLRDKYISSLNSYYKKDKLLAFEVAKKKEELLKACSISPKIKNPKVEQIMDKWKIISVNIHNIAKANLYFME